MKMKKDVSLPVKRLTDVKKKRGGGGMLLLCREAEKCVRLLYCISITFRNDFMLNHKGYAKKEHYISNF